MMNKFWIKTFLHGATPGGYGYVRQLKKHGSSCFDFEREKHPLRSKYNSKSGWGQSQEGKMLCREYESYQDYLIHQKQKFQEIIKLNGGFNNRTIVNYRLKFYRRFRCLQKYLARDAVIVCLGARQGTEVDVLRDMGYSRAIGVDLFPGPNNLLVIEGDFMNLPYNDESVDCIYTNCLDHAFNLENALKEHRRILKPKGYALYDLPLGDFKGAFEAVCWEKIEDIYGVIRQYFSEFYENHVEGRWNWILSQKEMKD